MADKSSLKHLLPFWLFVLLFKFGAGLHYTLLSTLGSRVLPLWIVGLLVGGASFVQLVLDVPAGYALDRFGYLTLLRWGTIVFMVGALLLTLGLSVPVFIMTVALGTVGWLFFAPGTNAYVLTTAPREVAGKYIGFFHTFSSAGIVLATVVLTFVIGRSAPLVGLIVAGILAIALIAVYLAPRERGSVHDERKILHHTYYIRRHFLHHVLRAVRRLNPASTLLVLQNLTAAAFYGAIWFTIPLVLLEHTHQHLLGISLSVFDLAIVILGSLLGTLADRWDQRKLVLCGLLLFGGTGTLLGFNLNLWFLVLGFLATAGDEMSSVSLWAWLDRLDTKHNEDGLVNGAIVLFDDLGWMLGPMIAGVLFTRLGANWTIALMGLPILVVWIVAIASVGARSSVSSPASLAAHEHPHRLRHKR